jgi:rod shape determining protein RodA
METTLLDRLKRIDFILIAIPAALALISIPVINSVVINSATTDILSYPRPVFVQILSFAMGYVFLVIAARFDVEHFSKFYRIIWILCLLIQLTVFVPGLRGEERGGSNAWIDLGFTTIQPSELVKITFIIAFAAYLRKHRDELASLKGFIRALMFAAPIIALVTYIDMGAGIVVAVIFIGMVFAAGLRGSLFLRIVAVVALLFPIG